MNENLFAALAGRVVLVRNDDMYGERGRLALPAQPLLVMHLSGEHRLEVQIAIGNMNGQNPVGV